MRTVWKYELEMDLTTLPPLCNPDVLYIDHDPSGSPCAWVEHEPDQKPNTRVRIRMVGTGHTIQHDDGTYVGSLMQGPFVWHFYANGVKV